MQVFSQSPALVQLTPGKKFPSVHPSPVPDLQVSVQQPKVDWAQLEAQACWSLIAVLSVPACWSQV